MVHLADGGKTESPISIVMIRYFSILLLMTLANTALAEDLPVCFSSDAKTGIEATVVAHQIQGPALLARLVFAEGLSTGFADDHLVYDAIAWGAMNRVLLGERSSSMRRTYGEGVHGVIFKKGQFNPDISTRSPFSKAFLCPDHAGRWAMAKSAAHAAGRGTGNPFIQTSWEKRHRLSLVVDFYYPQSIQAKNLGRPGKITNLFDLSAIL